MTMDERPISANNISDCLKTYFQDLIDKKIRNINIAKLNADCQKIIQCSPTYDCVIHAVWEETEDEIGTPIVPDEEFYSKCSNCGCYNYAPGKYCSNCGAKMY